VGTGKVALRLAALEVATTSHNTELLALRDKQFSRQGWWARGTTARSRENKVDMDGAVNHIRKVGGRTEG